MKKPTLDQVEQEALAQHWLAVNPYAPHPKPIVMVGLTKAWLEGKRAAPLSADVRRGLIDFLTRAGIRHCRICGCTEDFACRGGCSWSAEDETVCSRCYGPS